MDMHHGGIWRLVDRLLTQNLPLRNRKVADTSTPKGNGFRRLKGLPMDVRPPELLHTVGMEPSASVAHDAERVHITVASPNGYRLNREAFFSHLAAVGPSSSSQTLYDSTNLL